MAKKRQKLSLHKIEIDDNTLEPTIVEVSAEHEDMAESASGAAAAQSPGNTGEQKQPSLEEVHNEGKQIVMNKLFGINEKETVSRRQKIFKKVFTALFVVLVVGVLALTFYHDFFSGTHEAPKPGELAAILSESWFYILFALLSLFLCFLLKGSKLSLMCRAATKKWHFKTCMETAVVGHYYNYVTPLAVGGQPFEIYHLATHGVSGGVAASLPIATFSLNQFAFVILGIFSLIAYHLNLFGTSQTLLSVFPTTFTVLAIIGLVCCLLMPSLVLLFSMLPKIGQKLVTWVIKIGEKLRIVKKPEETTQKTIKNVQHNAQCLKQLASSPLVFILSFLISFGEQLALCSIAYFTLRFFGFDIPNVNGFVEWLQIVQLCLILYAAISFIPTPGNSGAADLSFYVLFSTGVTFAGGAFTAMILWRFLSFYSFIIIGFIFTTLKRKADKKRAALADKEEHAFLSAPNDGGAGESGENDK